MPAKVLLSSPLEYQSMAASNIVPQDAELEQTRTYVKEALSKHLKGDSGSYNFVVGQLQSQDDPVVLRRLYIVLVDCIGIVGKSPDAYQALLNAVFKFDWHYRKEVSEMYLHFLTHLVSANGTYLLASFHNLARNLLPPLNMAAISAGASAQLPNSSDKEETFDLVHKAIDTLLKIAPSGTTILFPVLAEHFPHKRVDKDTQRIYLQQLLRIATSLSFFKDRIFSLVVEKLIEIDVEIKLDEKEEDLLFDMEDLWNDDAKQMEAIDVMADKLDVLMLLVFEYVDQQLALGAEPSVQLFQLLMQVFERSMLHTHRSKYTQFLIFYVCKESIEFVDAFVGKLLSIMLDDKKPAVTRQSAAAFLASFLARAKFVEQSSLRSALTHMLQWIVEYLDNAADQDAVDTEETQKRHGVFFTVAQAVFYLLCFQGGFIASSDHGRNFLAQYPWEKITQNTLTPLKFCLESVRREFYHVAAVLRLLSPEAIADLESQEKGTSSSNGSTATPAVAVPEAATSKNKPSRGIPLSIPIIQRANSNAAAVSRKRQRAGVGGMGKGSNPLDSFFPFDPYLLRRSYHYIGEIYNVWEAIDEEGLESESEGSVYSDQEGEEEEEDDESETDEETPYPYSSQHYDEDNLVSSYVSQLSVSDEPVSGLFAGGKLPMFGNFGHMDDFHDSSSRSNGVSFEASDDMAITPVGSLQISHMARALEQRGGR